MASGSYSAGSILVLQINLAGNTTTKGQLGAITIDTKISLSTAAITAVIDKVGFSRAKWISFLATITPLTGFSGSISGARWRLLG